MTLSEGGLTGFGRWIGRRGPFVRGMLYGFMIFGYVVVGAVVGFFDGIREGVETWREDRNILEYSARRAAPPSSMENPE